MQTISLLCWSLMVAWYPLLSNAYLNVFISHKEVMKLMGLEADLFYVHEGTINTYAMQFTVPVPEDMHDLEFSWQSLTAYPLPYAISIVYEHYQEALSAPTLSIPERGYVPQQVEKFVVHLPCSGNVTEQVPLTINMLVKGPPRHNNTKLHFKRNKNCIQAPKQSAEPAHAPSQDSAMLSAATCVLGVILVVGLIASTMYLRARKHMRQNSLHNSFNTTAYGSHQNVFIRLDPSGRPSSVNSGSYATIASLNNYTAEPKTTCSIFEKFRKSPTTNAPYATGFLPIGDQGTDAVYSKPEALYPSRIPYYASAQLTQAHSMSSAPRLNNGNDYVFVGPGSHSASGYAAGYQSDESNFVHTSNDRNEQFHNRFREYG